MVYLVVVVVTVCVNLTSKVMMKSQVVFKIRVRILFYILNKSKSNRGITCF